MRRFGITVLCLLSVPLWAQFKNIKVAEATQETALDPTVSIDIRQTNVMVMGIGANRAFRSHDGGATWTEEMLESTYGAGSEPAVVSDVKGHFYYFHLADPAGQGPTTEGWLDRIVCHKSDDGGAHWSKGVSIGNNPPKDQRSAWPSVHPKRPILYLAWTQFDTYGLSDANCHSNLQYSISTNAGGKWSKPVQVNQTPGDCSSGDNAIEGGMVAVGLDGRIYLTWANQGIIFFDRSYDGGEMWLSNDIAIAKQYSGWSMKVPGYKSVSGRPVLAMDNSTSRAHGSLYVTYADQVNGEGDTDIWFLRSTNKGDVWTKPVRANADKPGTHQYMPWMTVDQVTGNIYIIYYSRGGYTDNQTDVYMAYSWDGGNTFKEVKLSESPFVPTETATSNQQINITAHDGVIVPVWTRMDNGKASVWTTVIKDEVLLRK